MQNMFSDNHRIKPEINRKKCLEKSPNIWKLNSILLSISWIKRKIIEYFEVNENEILWNEAKAVL